MASENTKAEEDRFVDKSRIVRGKRSPEKQKRAVELRQQMTPAEAKLWQYLRRNGCGGLHFRRQQVLDGFIADFYCHSAGLVIELDGGIHEQQVDYDTVRESLLRARGLQILRFPNEQVLSNIETVLATILHTALPPSTDP